MSFRAENNTNISKVIQLTFKATGPTPVNFKMPLSKIPCEVLANQNTPIIHFTKLDPSKDWGDFEWNFTIGNDNSFGMQNTYN